MGLFYCSFLPIGGIFYELSQDSWLAIVAVGIPTVTWIKMLLESCWTALVHFFSFQSLFSSQQYPLPPNGGVEYPTSPTAAAGQADPSDMLEFPPLGAIDGFTCQYPGLKNKYIALPDGNQSLWLQPLEKDIQDEQYDIDTDYEIKAPTGVIRDVGREVSLVLRIQANSRTSRSTLT